MQKYLRLDFVPANINVALLVLRVWFGASMAFLHGWGKFNNLMSGTHKFPDIIGIGATPALALAVFAELVCSILIIIGLWTRLAAVFLIVTMGVAFFVAHRGMLSGERSGEMAFLYLGVYVTLLIAGAGKYSVDRK